MEGNRACSIFTDTVKSSEAKGGFRSSHQLRGPLRVCPHRPVEANPLRPERRAFLCHISRSVDYISGDMIKTGMNIEVGTADAELVTKTSEGNRDAFGQIVSRYQALICSLAYSATGSLGQSEDLAQETFITAWKHLGQLREPGKLRAWLCGIARNRIGSFLRREGRGRLQAPESLEMIPEPSSGQPLPCDQAISNEEAALLWQSIQHIPDAYREPLVLFYREGESVTRVAAVLDLSEDAVRQRLSRGRKLLHDQVLALVEGTLRKTTPGKTFTLAVITALPLLGGTAEAATAGAAVKASPAGKSVLAMAAVGTILLFYSLLAFLASLGGWAGYVMSRACATSSKQCENIIRFWRTVAIGFSFCLCLWLVFPPLLAFVRPWLISFGWMRPFILEHYLGGLKAWTDLFCGLALIALALWVRRSWRDFPNQDAVTQTPTTRLHRTRFIVWLSLGMIGPACLVVLFLWSMLNQTVGPMAEKRLTAGEVQRIVTERKDAHFAVWRGWNGTKNLHIALPEESGRFTICATADEAMLRMLDRNNIDYNSIRADMQEPWPFGRLLTAFLAAMGGVLLLRHPPKWLLGNHRARERQKPGTAELRVWQIASADSRQSADGENLWNVFAVVFLLVFGANALAAKGLYVVLFVGLIKGAFLGLVAAIGVLCLRVKAKVG